MSLATNIYGSAINILNPLQEEYVENWGTDNPKEQFWRRRELPSMFDDIRLGLINAKATAIFFNSLALFFLIGYRLVL